MTTGTTRTAGRPRSFDEAVVLDRALEVFWANGYRSTTTRDLEHELGLGPSSLYNAFGSKHDLLLRAIELYEERITERVVRPLEESGQGLDALAAFFRDLIDWITHGGKRGCMIINLTAELGGEHPGIGERTAAYRRRVKAALRAALQRAANNGETDPAGLDDRATLLYGLVLGVNVAARGGADRDEIEALLTSTLGTLSSWRI